jgi:hypothetical protein
MSKSARQLCLKSLFLPQRSTKAQIGSADFELLCFFVAKTLLTNRARPWILWQR